MFCSKCGTKVDETDKFCPACGTPVKVESQGNFTISSQADQPSPQPAYRAPVQPAMQQSTQQQKAPYQNQAYQQTGFNPSNDKAAVVQKKKMQWWQIVLMVVAALLCLFILIGIFGGDDSGNSNNGNYTPDYSFDTTPTSKAQKTKTVMIYMVGSDLESLYGAGSIDIVEMMDCIFCIFKIIFLFSVICCKANGNFFGYVRMSTKSFSHSCYVISAAN